MNKHTPAPWTIETVPTAVGICHKIMPFSACIYVDDRHDVNPKEMEANAHLIEAAPELLAVAKQTYELTAKWQRLGLFDPLKTAVTPADVRELEDFELALENAIFTAAPDYEPLNDDEAGLQR